MKRHHPLLGGLLRTGGHAEGNQCQCHEKSELACSYMQEHMLLLRRWKIRGCGTQSGYKTRGKRFRQGLAPARSNWPIMIRARSPEMPPSVRLSVPEHRKPTVRDLTCYVSVSGPRSHTHKLSS